MIKYDKKNSKVASNNQSKLMEEAKLEQLTNRISNIDENDSQIEFPPIQLSRQAKRSWSFIDSNLINMF